MSSSQLDIIRVIIVEWWGVAEKDFCVGGGLEGEGAAAEFVANVVVDPTAFTIISRLDSILVPIDLRDEEEEGVSATDDDDDDDGSAVVEPPLRRGGKSSRMSLSATPTQCNNLWMKCGDQTTTKGLATARARKNTLLSEGDAATL